MVLLSGGGVGVGGHNGLLKSHWYHLFGCHIDVMLIPVGMRMSPERIEEELCI